MFSTAEDSLLYSKEAAAVPLLSPALTKTLEVDCPLSGHHLPIAAPRPQTQI